MSATEFTTVTAINLWFKRFTKAERIALRLAATVGHATYDANVEDMLDHLRWCNAANSNIWLNTGGTVDGYLTYLVDNDVAGIDASRKNALMA